MNVFTKLAVKLNITGKYVRNELTGEIRLRKYKTKLEMVDVGGVEKPFYRIIATRQLLLNNNRVLPAGAKGGLMEEPDALSHDGISWLDEGSILLSGSEVVDDAYVIRSKIGENSLISERAIIKDSTVENSNISGNSIVKKSEVRDWTNLSDEVFVYKSYLFRCRLNGKTNVTNATLKSVCMDDSNVLTCKFTDSFIEVLDSGNPAQTHIYSSSVWKNVNITFSKLSIKSDFILKNAKGKELKLNVLAPAVIQYIDFSWKTKCEIGESTAETKIVGEDRENPLILSGTIGFRGNDGNFINGAIKIFGNWDIWNCFIHDYVQLKYQGKGVAELSKSMLKDFSSISIHDTFHSKRLSALENQDLSSDDELIMNM